MRKTIIILEEEKMKGGGIRSKQNVKGEITPYMAGSLIRLALKATKLDRKIYIEIIK